MRIGDEPATQGFMARTHNVKRLILTIVSCAVLVTAAQSKKPAPSAEDEMTVDALLAYVAATFAPFLSSSPLKRRHPGELVLSTVVSSDCKLSEATASSAAKSVLVRSRIKPLDEFPSKSEGDHFFLSVSVDCLEAGEVYVVSVDFADVVAGVPVRFGTGYGSFGTYANDTHYLLDAVEDNVRAAIAEYWQANASGSRHAGAAATGRRVPAAGIHTTSMRTPAIP